VGYLAMIDIGATIYALALNSTGGSEISTALVLLRTISLLLVTTGLFMVREIAKKNDVSKVASAAGRSSYRGIGRYSPLAALLFIYGALSLIGVPLTPGFTGKWALITLAGQQSTQGAVIIVLAMVAGAIGLIKWAVGFWESDQPGDFVKTSKQRGSVIASGAVLLFGIALAIWPRFPGELLNLISVP